MSICRRFRVHLILDLRMTLRHNAMTLLYIDDAVVRECFTKCYPGTLPGMGQTEGAELSVASALATVAAVSGSQA